MTLTRQLGSDADQVFTAYRTGAVSASLAVHLLDEDQKHVMTVTLTNARLTRYTQYVEGGVLTEEVSIGYNDIKVETENTGGGGTTT
jgi:type VI protein secretion system component Hcp